VAEPQIGARIVVKGQDQFRADFARMSQDADASLSRIGRSISTAGSAGSKAVQAATSVTKAAVSAATAGIGIISSLVTTVTGAVGTAIGAVNTLAGAFGVAGTVATVGVGGLLFAAKSFAQSVAEGVSESKDLADSVGLSVEELTRLQSVVRLAGGDAGKFGEAIKAMNRKVLDLAAGNEQAEESFEQLGLSIGDFRDKKGNLVGTRQQMDLIIDRLSKIRNPALQAKASMDVLGKAGKDLGGLFTEGAKGLREAEKDVERYGTTVKEELADEMNEVLAQQLKLQESLKGMGLSFGKIFFPFFASSAERVSDWLNMNRTRVEDFLTSTVSFVEKVRDDVVGLFTGSDDFNFSLFDKIAGPLGTLKSLALDAWDALMGRGFGDRVPELKAFADVLVAAANAAFRMGQLLAKALSLEDLPDAQTALVGIKNALEAFVGRIDGLDSLDFAWAANLGGASVAAAAALGTLFRIIVDNRDAISAFVRDGLRGLSDGLKAIESLINGTPIAGDNVFAFLDDWKRKAEDAVTFITGWIKTLTGDFDRAGGTLLTIGKSVFDMLDGLGRLLGLGDGSEGSAGREAAIVVAVLALTGALNLLVPLAAVVAGLASALASLVSIIGTVGGWVLFFGEVFAGMTVAAAAAWAVFAAGLGFAAYESIKYIIANFGDMVEGFKVLWGLVASLAGAAWDGIKYVFGGMIDFFRNPIEKIKGMFAALWDGVKSGAASAWNTVKGWFGGGTPPAMNDNTGGDGEALPSFDVGGVVPGSAGAPRRAIVHGGERILTVAETGLFDRLLGGLGAMASFDPSSAFAAAPLAMPSSRGGGSGLVAGGLDIIPGEGQFLATAQTWKGLKGALQKNGMGVRTQRARR
jgi:hypothetical protein